MIYFFKRKKYLVLTGCLLLSFVMGSIHAFSMLLDPIESKYDVPRTFSSFTYSISLISITTAVYFGNYIYKIINPTRIILLVVVLSTLGTLMSAYLDSIFFVWIGFGLFFGFANGIGYGYSLQYSAIAIPDFKALMMGLVTASYGLGATIAPIFYKITILIGGFVHTMISLTIVLLITNFVVLLLFRFANIKFNVENEIEPQENNFSTSKNLLWLIYGFSIASGLMCFGHAAGIAKIYFISPDYVFIIPILMGFLNMSGGILFSSIIKKYSYKKIILFLSYMTSISLFILYMIPSKISVLMCLLLVSISYGGIISIFPSMINKIFGTALGIKIYGFVFTAWGLFGLLMPLLAGLTFDIFESYSYIVLFSSILSIFPVIIIRLKYKILLI